MDEKTKLSIDQFPDKWEESPIYDGVTKQIHEEESGKLLGIPKQADNWSALANQVVGAKNIEA
jgi:hypothetical protein